MASSNSNIKHLPLSDKERLQMDLLGVHASMTKQDEINRRENRIKLIISERAGWWKDWETLCENYRNKEYCDALILIGATNAQEP